MVAAVSKGGSPQVARPGSRTDSPLDPNNTLFKTEEGMLILLVVLKISSSVLEVLEYSAHILQNFFEFLS